MPATLPVAAVPGVGYGAACKAGFFCRPIDTPTDPMPDGDAVAAVPLPPPIVPPSSSYTCSVKRLSRARQWPQLEIRQKIIFHRAECVWNALSWCAMCAA